MTPTPTGPDPTQRLIAIDVDMLDTDSSSAWNRLADRIAAMRRDTILVYVGKADVPGLPTPDYVIDRDAPSITRFPGAVRVEEWPSPSDRAGLDDALEHIAEGLLIPWSHVYCILGSTTTIREHLDRAVVLDAGFVTDDARRATVDESRLIAAFDELQLHGGATTATRDICETAFRAARDTLARNTTELGFTAASAKDNLLNSHDANYAAVWARDGVIAGLWTLCLDNTDLIDTFRRTIRVLARHQTPAGQIPGNVRLADERPDYSGIGGIASIDSVIWFVIGAVRLAFHTGDRAFAEEIAVPVERAMAWLAAHDANNDGLIEIPESSDWMDIFPRSYNVLYDEVLWGQACRDTAVLLDGLGRHGSDWAARADRVRGIILDQFWPSGEQLMEIAGAQSGKFSPGEAYYLLSQITPFDYGWRCDVYANLLAALGGLLDERKLDRLFTFLWGVGANSPFPVTCLYPPIASGADDWKDYFLVNFLNITHHYHNGGIWPFIGGLWIRFLAATGRVELAHRELASLAEACRIGLRGDWEFNEWLHGQTGRPMGKAHQAWSAASYVHAYATLHLDADPGAFPDLDPTAISGK
ncbi:MAG: glycoside hydrolase 100 family protein [Acidimicrobiia bacterium]